MKNTNIVAIVGASVLGAIIVAAGAMLFLSLRQMKYARAQRDAAVTTLKQLHSSNPFPSEANVATNRFNLKQSEAWFAQLTEELGKGGVAYDADLKSPPQFMQKLQRTQLALLQRAPTFKNPRALESSEKSIVAPDFMFGFDRYLKADASMPLPEDVSHLTQQLAMTERICDVLYGAGIVKLKKLERESFERASVPSGGFPVDAGSTTAAGPRTDRRRSSRERPSGDMSDLGKSGSAKTRSGMEPELYTSQRFKVELSSDEQAIAAVLNAFGTNDLFSVVQQCSFERRDDGVYMPSEADRADIVNENGVTITAKNRRPSERMVSGSSLGTPIDSSFVIDVYTFKGE